MPIWLLRKTDRPLAKPGTKPLLHCIVCSLVTTPTKLFRLPYRWEYVSQFEKRINSSRKQSLLKTTYYFSSMTVGLLTGKT
jgi:hypothetical protein